MPENVKPSIVVIAYNRPAALSRLLNSIEKAHFEEDDITLVISIDGGGDPLIADIAKGFNWRKGNKRIITHETNLGLRSHVLECGDLTREYGSIIMLEEDCFVAPGFYNYVQQCLDFYTNSDKVAGISLYKYENIELVGLSFFVEVDEFDSFFMQVPSSWGQAWTKNQWENFKKFYDSRPVILKSDKLPDPVKAWPETSWKKYFYKFLVDSDKYIVYPSVSQSTNFGDVGLHTLSEAPGNQVTLDFRIAIKFRLPAFKETRNKFDAYFEWVPDDFCCDFGNIGLDLNGMKQLELFENKLFYSIKSIENPIQLFGYSLRPAYNNILYQLGGDVIKLGRNSDFTLLDRPILERIYAQQNLFGFHAGYSLGRIDGKKFVENSKSFRLARKLNSLQRILRKGK